MDWVTQKQTLREGFRKYRYLLLAALLGIFFMVLPERSEEKPPQTEVPVVKPSDLEESLSKLLSSVAGAGQVEVLLTQREGECTVYQSDEASDQSGLRSDTVLVTDGDRRETGLIRQVLPPVYRGAVIVCQGADNAQVRLAIVEAVKSVTGLTSDHITVLKMK